MTLEAKAKVKINIIPCSNECKCEDLGCQPHSSSNLHRLVRAFMIRHKKSGPPFSFGPMVARQCMFTGSVYSLCPFSLPCTKVFFSRPMEVKQSNNFASGRGLKLLSFARFPNVTPPFTLSTLWKMSSFRASSRN